MMVSFYLEMHFCVRYYVTDVLVHRCAFPKKEDDDDDDE
jgi:hypothetical protein